jgi:hypothetical protein
VNPRGSRQCRACMKASSDAYRARQRS